MKKFDVFAMRRFQVNGRTVLTVDYHRAAKMDLIKDGEGVKILEVFYNAAGEFLRKLQGFRI